MLPTPPASPRGTTTGYPTTAATPPGSTTSGTTRISTSLEVNTSRDLACEDGLRRQSSVTEGETIRIVIHDVDTDHRKGESSSSQVSFGYVWGGIGDGSLEWVRSKLVSLG